MRYFFKQSEIVYYVILLLVLVSWTNVNSLPPLIFRLMYLSAVVVPLWINRNKFTPEILFAFVIISGSSFAVSYMPVDGMYISIVLLFTYIFSRPYVDRLQMPASFVILALLALFVDLFNFENTIFSYKLFAVILASLFISKSDEDTLKFVTITIILISLVLGLEFITMGNKFISSVSTIDGELERKGWTDPNYFGAVIGYGVIASFISLLEWPNMKKRLKWGIYGTLVISLYAILITASRGVFVAIATSLGIFFLFGSVRFGKKVLFLLIGGLIVLLFYQLGFFDLILLRFQSDSGDAGGRIIIWEARLKAFFNDCNILQQLFGVGFHQSRYLGTPKLLGSHNDYIAILTSYGFVGLIALFSIFLYPIRKAKEYKSYVLIAILYMIICMFSIEPFTSGHWSCYYFYLYILLLSQYRSSNK